MDAVNKKNYQYILFDLDGTLTDPGLGITNSVMYALKKFNIEVTDRTSLYKFIGPPLSESFQKFYGFSEEQSEQAVVYYREYFKDKGLYENEVYEGVESVLEQLKAMGKTVVLATSKPEVFATEILRHFHLDKYFDFIAGATLDSTRNKKADVIAYALETCGIEDTATAVMIGDREHDILGANQYDLDSVGVLCGYGDYAELEKAGATYIVEHITDILKYIM